MTNTTSETDGLSPSRPPEDLLGRLSQSDPLADLIIDVEGHQLHTSKYMLANASSKFCQMLTDATSVNPNILPLPGVSLQAAVELLRWLLPSETLTISGRFKHDDVIKRKHFSRYWPFLWGIHWPSHKGQWRGAFMFSSICAQTISWANNRDAGDLRRHRTHYDVTVML